MRRTPKQRLGGVPASAKKSSNESGGGTYGQKLLRSQTQPGSAASQQSGARNAQLPPAAPMQKKGSGAPGPGEDYLSLQIQHGKVCLGVPCEALLIGHFGAVCWLGPPTNTTIWLLPGNASCPVPPSLQPLWYLPTHSSKPYVAEVDEMPGRDERNVSSFCTHAPTHAHTGTNKYQLSVPKTATVQDVQQHVRSLTQIPAENQRLLYKGIHILSLGAHGFLCGIHLAPNVRLGSGVVWSARMGWEVARDRMGGALQGDCSSISAHFVPAPLLVSPLEATLVPLTSFPPAPIAFLPVQGKRSRRTAAACLKWESRIIARYVCARRGACDRNACILSLLLPVHVVICLRVTIISSLAT